MVRSDSRDRRGRRSRSRSGSRSRASRRSKSRHESHKHKRHRSRSRSNERRHKEHSKDKRRRESRERSERSDKDSKRTAVNVSERTSQRQKTEEEIAKEQEDERKAAEAKVDEAMRELRERQERQERLRKWQASRAAQPEEKNEDEAEGKAWTLDDEEEDDVAADADAEAQEVPEPDNPPPPLPPLQAGDDDVDADKHTGFKRQRADSNGGVTGGATPPPPPASSSSASAPLNGFANGPEDVDDDVDPLDAFMSEMLAGVDYVPVADIRPSAAASQTKMVINEGGPAAKVITLDDIMNRRQLEDWESDIAESPMPSPFEQAEEKETKEEREEREKREFMEAMRRHHDADEEKSETVMDLEENSAAEKQETGLGRIFEGEGDMIEEYEVAEREKTALEILEEAAKKKELKPVDHTAVDYIPFRKNLYILPRALARLSDEEVSDRRNSLEIRVRGSKCPPPVETWEQCGLSERILAVIHKLEFKDPFPIQKQAVPAIMCGRDVIGVAKTGSGKTLAFLLPMFRHILDQPRLGESEGPVGLIMAPARELAVQIFNEARKFSKPLGLRVACIYGGAGVAEQIADLKRGADIVVCTPGRMIDILGMQAGKLVSLKRVTFVVMDEADRMFDMGFEPQIRMILSNIRPDRQTVLFSATFPKQIEKLAKTVLKYPVEIIVGGRSVASRDITQYVEVRDEDEKFMRLLQLLGVWYERGNVLVFVDKQEKCDSLFQELLKYGYVSVTLHGGKDQLDRDHTIHEFKTQAKTLMVATSVAGRGLDVPELVCVINYNCPNHLEDYVHRVGRTGRAGRKGTAYTFIAPTEDMYSPMLMKALQQAKQEVPEALVEMTAAFKAKVDRGEARWASSGFVGKGFTFDENEKTEAQKFADAQRNQYLIAEGIINPDEAHELDALEAEAEEEALLEQTDKLQSSDATESSAAADATTAATGAATGTAQQVAVDKAKEMVKKMSAVESARRQAELIAAQLGGKPAAATPSLSDHCQDELEINDYPPLARRKVQQRETLDRVVDLTGVAIISRGEYIDPKTKPEAGKRKLYLLIEGPSEISVKQARLELLRVLEEETLRTGASSGGGSGRYSVV